MLYYIADEKSPPSYINMFAAYGHEPTERLQDADFVLFTGGEDVNPALYGQGKHHTTQYNTTRDKKESRVFNTAVRAGKPVVGICRGAQLLNVLSGGDMYQDVDNHIVLSGRHPATDEVTGEELHVTSYHHQQMIPGKHGHVFLSSQNIATKKSWCSRHGQQFYKRNDKDDIEGIYYPKTRAVCMQGHPEKVLDFNDRYTQYFFEVLDRYLNIPSEW